MKKFLLAVLVALAALTAPAAAERTRIRPQDVASVQMDGDGRPETAPTARMVADRIYTPPPGYRVAYYCGNQCSYWLVENDTFYDGAVYVAQVLWMSAVALLGMLACLGLMLIMFCVGRDVLRRDSAGTKKVLSEMA